jgi:hypothetical protein
MCIWGRRRQRRGEEKGKGKRKKAGREMVKIKGWGR